TAGSRPIGPNVTGQFEDYMREITPTYARDSRRPGAAAKPQEREKLFRAQDREAMYFFSETHMR
ncbi:hypothetical protein, partial [Rhodoblastus sp.]|uniref:hypothetical protein n=1 Tax=Rhodoblastus sp. TaxID=1962975 RepID=UPI003F9CB416